MKNHYVIRVIGVFTIPIIMLYALYVQFHGEYTPGGGFQAGVIFASAFIIYDIIFGRNNLNKIITINSLQKIAAVGCLIYCCTGVLGILGGRNFLDYSVLLSNYVAAQQMGIMIVELGVGSTVFAVCLIFYYIFSGDKDNA